MRIELAMITRYLAAKIAKPETSPQGRPMGLLIAVAMFDCEKNKLKHQAYARSGIDYLNRWAARKYALRRRMCFASFFRGAASVEGRTR